MPSIPQEPEPVVSKLPSPSEIIALDLVEVADTGGHHYWLGDVYLEGLDPVPVVVVNGRAWHVIRLLLPAPKGSQVRYVNACGLRTCVNTEHWKFVPARLRVVMTDFDGKGWRKNG